jgi:hypothetical protein
MKPSYAVSDKRRLSVGPNGGVGRPAPSERHPKMWQFLNDSFRRGAWLIASFLVLMSFHGQRTCVASCPAGSKAVKDLISQLYEPKNKVRYRFSIVPGGEILEFSAPVRTLIALGKNNRKLFHKLIEDPKIQNEIVLILGAVGDETTIPLLITAHPETKADFWPKDGPLRLKLICFSFALTYLTGEPIGRSRIGYDFDTGNKRKWEEWWNKNKGTFVVPTKKPNATWMPLYPESADTVR